MSKLWLGLNFVDQLGGDPDRPIQRYANTGKKGGKEIPLIAFDIRQKAASF